MRAGVLLGELLALKEVVEAMNYGQARGMSSPFFEHVTAEAARTTDAGLKTGHGVHPHAAGPGHGGAHPGRCRRPRPLARVGTTAAAGARVSSSAGRAFARAGRSRHDGDTAGRSGHDVDTARALTIAVNANGVSFSRHLPPGSWRS